MNQTLLYKPGEREPSHPMPANGKTWTLDEVQGLVGGYVQLIQLDDGLHGQASGLGSRWVRWEPYTAAPHGSEPAFGLHDARLPPSLVATRRGGVGLCARDDLSG